MFAVILQKSSLLFEKATKAKDRDDESVDKAMVLATSNIFFSFRPVAAIQLSIIRQKNNST